MARQGPELAAREHRQMCGSSSAAHVELELSVRQYLISVSLDSKHRKGKELATWKEFYTSRNSRSSLKPVFSSAEVLEIKINRTEDPEIWRL